MKITILGGLAKQKYFDDTTDEVWGLNAIRHRWVKQWHRMFNLHMYEHLVRDWERGLKIEKKWIKKHKDVPFYVCDEWPGFPYLEIFPRKKMDYFMRPDYHCGSFDWMVAFAIHLGATEINLQGINLVRESGEPISARACLEYWCGVAEGQGIKVNIANDCFVLRNYSWKMVKVDQVYSYDDFKLVIDEDQEKEYVDLLNRYKDLLDEVERLKNNE